MKGFGGLTGLMASINVSLPGIRLEMLGEYISGILGQLAGALRADGCILSTRAHQAKHGGKFWLSDSLRIQGLDPNSLPEMLGRATVRDVPLDSLPALSIVSLPTEGFRTEALIMPGTENREVMYLFNAPDLEGMLEGDIAKFLAIGNRLLRAYDRKVYLDDTYVSRLLLRVALEHIDLTGESPQPAFYRIIRRFLAKIGFERMTFLRPNMEDGYLYVADSVSVPPGPAYPRGMITTRIFTDLFRGKKILLPDILGERDGSGEGADAFFSEYPLRSCILTPILVRGHLEGVISCGSVTRRVNLTRSKQYYMEQLGEVLGKVLESRRRERDLQLAHEENLRLKLAGGATSGVLRSDAKKASSGSPQAERTIPSCTSPAMQAVLQDALGVAESDAPVLLLGETGTGKEVLARHIHEHSRRGGRRMVTVNCAAVPHHLFESEFFGTLKGAFTSAHESRIGKFEVADGSTLFLDEIGELPPEAQAKLLRVLQEGEFERLGSTKTIRVDVRLIAATNKDLAEMVRRGLFRDDLYYRINVYPIRLPALRERTEDIPDLVWHFVREFEEKYGKSLRSIDRHVMLRLARRSWPGNIRELRNVLERAVLRWTGGPFRPLNDGPEPAEAPRPTLEMLEREYIEETLQACRGRIGGKGGAAEVLGLDRSTLVYRLKKLGVDAKKFK